jgi:hypothetical protein
MARFARWLGVLVKTCPSCNSRVDDGLIVCPNCKHDFDQPSAGLNVSQTIMGFPALSDILANEPAPEQDSAKQTLFGFPAQKAGMSPVAPRESPISEAEDSEPEYDESDATHLIPADQLQREFELNTPVAAAVEAHEPRMTMAGIPVSELSASPASIKSAWGLDEDSESDSTSVVPASAIFDKELSSKAGFSKRVETPEFPTSSTLMGMSLEDFNARLNTPSETDDNPVHSTQFAMPAVQAPEPAPSRPVQTEFDSGPSVELPTQMWNPSDELNEDNSQHRELLQKIRGDAAEKHGEPRAGVDRGTAENAKPLSVGPALGLAAGKVPAIPAPKSSGLGDASSLRSRLQQKLKGAVPEPLLKPPALPVIAAPVIAVKPAAVEPNFETAFELDELPEISIEAIVPMEPVSAHTDVAKEPRSLSSSGVLGGGTYVVSKKEEPPAPTVFPTVSSVPAPEDDEEFAFADTSIARPEPLPEKPVDAPVLNFAIGEQANPGHRSTPTIGGMPPAVERTANPLPTPPTAAPQIAAPQIAAPQIAAPQIAAPQIAAPQIAAPQIAAPQIAAPQVAAPQIAAPTFDSIPDAVNAIEAPSNELVTEDAPDKLIMGLQTALGVLGFLLVAGSALFNMIMGVGGIILGGVFGAFALALLAISVVPFDATAKNVAWTFLGGIVVAAAAAVLVFDLIQPMAGALAFGGGMASFFAAITGVVLNRILR